MKKNKNTKKNSEEIKDIKNYSENLVKNLINEASENQQNMTLFEKQYEEDFYTKEIGLKKNTYPSDLEQKRILEKYKNDFFEDFEEEEKNNNLSFFKVISITLICLLSISTLVLSVSLIKTKTTLVENKANLQEILDSSESIEEKLLEETLKEQIASLETENSELKQKLENDEEIESSESNNPLDYAKLEYSTENNSENSIENNSENSINEYTIQSGDTVWGISKKVYGNGGEYQKILDANGLTEDSVLQEGSILIIP